MQAIIAQVLRFSNDSIYDYYGLPVITKSDLFLIGIGNYLTQ